MEAEAVKRFGNGVECSEEGLHCLKSGGVGSDVARWSLEPSEGFRTYKRRRRGKSSGDSKSEDNGRAFAEVDSQTVRQILKEPPGVALVNDTPREGINSPTDHSDGWSQRPWNYFLECMYRSLSAEKDGLEKCIQDVLQSSTEIDTKFRPKESDQPDENRPDQLRSNSAAQNFLHEFPKETSLIPGVFDSGQLDSLGLHKTTEMCRHAWFSILVSNQFTSLCKLLAENFQGIKTESFFDLKLLNSRVKDGTYDHFPVLFLNDTQQVWEKIQGIGKEMISLAKDLSDMSRSCYNNQVQFRALPSDSHTTQGEDYCAFRVCTCRRCGDKADGRNCLICDSCEEMYHVSCIEPAVEQIPPKSWYCSSCTTSGIRLPHENCVVCEKLNAPKTNVRGGVGNDSSCTEDETPNEFGENSNELFEVEISVRSPSLGMCKICGCQILEAEKSRICAHSFCPSKHYHARCLTRKQLKSYGPRWYCPSCLCRSCLIDKDDDDVVLCDGCDHAYHIYCTDPPMQRVPTGSWFCRSCKAKLEGIRSAKMAYEKSEKKQVNERFRAFGVVGNQWGGGSCVELDNGGGMEMLLTAVNTLNSFQEDMAG